jgi:hypothetical protein
MSHCNRVFCQQAAVAVVALLPRLC